MNSNTHNQTSLNSKSPVLYQNGIIDIFKLQKIFELNINKIKKKGEFTSELVNNKLKARNFTKFI